MGYRQLKGSSVTIENLPKEVETARTVLDVNLLND